MALAAGMIPLSTAFQTTSTADLLAEGLMSLIVESGPQVALLTSCVLTIAHGQLISNTATVRIVASVAVALAQGSKPPCSRS